MVNIIQSLTPLKLEFKSGEAIMVQNINDNPSPSTYNNQLILPYNHWWGTIRHT